MVFCRPCRATDLKMPRYKLILSGSFYRISVLSDSISMNTTSCDSDKISREVTILDKRGLHLRFAGQIARIAMRFPAMVRLCKDQQSVDARSALSLLTLEATCGSRLLIHGEGEQASDAVREIGDFIDNYPGLG
jgi:phosphocarrier protein HPr